VTPHVSVGLKVGHFVGLGESESWLPEDVCLQSDLLKRTETGR